MNFNARQLSPSGRAWRFTSRLFGPSKWPLRLRLRIFWVLLCGFELWEVVTVEDGREYRRLIFGKRMSNPPQPN